MIHYTVDFGFAYAKAKAAPAENLDGTPTLEYVRWLERQIDDAVRLAKLYRPSTCREARQDIDGWLRAVGRIGAA